MLKNRINNYWLLAAILGVMLYGMYISYQDIEHARLNGVYTIVILKKERMGRNGWKVNSGLFYKGKEYKYNSLVDWEVFSRDEKSKRFFAKILEDNPAKGYWPIFIIEVPDSIKSAPVEGWSEEWMKEHFPNVVEALHDSQ